MSKTHNEKLRQKLNDLEKRLDEFQLNMKTCHSEHQDSISNQTKKIAKLEKKLQTLKVKLKKGNQKIKLLETKLEVAPDDAQSQKSQDTRISEPEAQSCDKGVTKRRLNYDVLAASEFSRNQISFRSRLTQSSTPFQLNEDDLMSANDQSTIPLSVESDTKETIDFGSKIMNKETTSSVGANEQHKKTKKSKVSGVKKRKTSNLVETWMEENNVLGSIGKGAIGDELHEVELIVQKEPEQNNKINDQVNKVLVNDQQDVIQQETGVLNTNPSSNDEQPNNAKSNKQKLSPRKTKENTTQLKTVIENDISEEMKEGSTQKSKHNVYVCEYCTKSFMDSLSLRRHLETSHSDAEKEYICQVCKSTFSRADDFYRHVKTHQVPKNDLKCSFCSKVFKRKQVLKSHEMIHHKIKLYKCEKCTKKFYSQDPLKRHQAKCLGRTQLFTCGTCAVTSQVD